MITDMIISGWILCIYIYTYIYVYVWGDIHFLVYEPVVQWEVSYLYLRGLADQDIVSDLLGIFLQEKRTHHVDNKITTRHMGN